MSKGHLVVPKAADSEALPLPVLSFNKGEGPRLLITAGCHGNELEGPIVARRLLDWLPRAQECGRVIIVPVLNPPALKAWSRNSPVDGLNLNRVFPGRADGSISERIADAVSRVLCQGSTQCLICTALDRGGNLLQQARRILSRMLIS
ncbi:succinylglutamate desuccinylase/aspartoacylase family protein [Mesorhizobium sp. M0678]|uniref:succinylglutamate desuccinylase/aspartoacylase domain-containing protein n=1 Tax=Mesorhizobium sp. M0678 TaxID=2956985 RepID=UPI00333538F0